jgi:hypothetical protein
MCWEKMICYKGISIMTWRQHEIWIDVHIGTRTAIVHFDDEYLMFTFNCPWWCKDCLFLSFHRPFCAFAQPHRVLFIVLPHAMKSDFDLIESDWQRNKVCQEVSISKELWHHLMVGIVMSSVNRQINCGWQKNSLLFNCQVSGQCCSLYGQCGMGTNCE